MLRLVFDPQGDLRRASQACEEEVFAARYGNSAAQLAEEYGPYAAASMFVAIADDHDDVVAAARLILPSPAGLKTIVDLGRSPWNLDGPQSAEAAGLNLDETWDLTTVAVRPGFWGINVRPAMALWYGVFLAPQLNDVRNLVAILDTRVQRVVASLGIFVSSLPGASPAPYLGSPASTPIHTDIVTMLALQKTHNPAAHSQIAMGSGHPGIHIPKPGISLVSADSRRNHTSADVYSLTDSLTRIP
jgi:hypothetical protein